MGQCSNKNQTKQAWGLTKGAKTMLNAVPVQLWHNHRDYATHDCFFNIVSNKLDVFIILQQLPVLLLLLLLKAR